MRSPDTMAPFVINAALSDQATELSDIAQQAKGAWGCPAHWMEAWRESLTIAPEHIARQSYFVATDDQGALVGFVGLHRREIDTWLEHFWVRPERWGRGVGRALFKRAVEQARSLGLTSFLIEADPNAADFYRRMGARQIGEESSEMEGIERVLPVLVYDFDPG